MNGNGNYTLSVEGKGNYTGEVHGVEWNLVPIVLGIPNFEVSTLLKSYDGTTEIDPEIREFLGEDGTNTYTLVRGTDYSLTASYAEPDVLGAEKSKIEYTVKLISKNYVLSLGDGKTGDTVQGTINGTITKAAAPMQTNRTLLVTNHLERTYTCELSKWLAVLDAGKTYGTIGYELENVALNEGYYTSGAKIENGQLILPVNAVDSSTESSIGTVTIKVTTTNYEDMTLTVNVNAVNRIAPVGEPTLSKTTISYGEKIGSITLSGVMKDGDQDVAGTFAWADGDVRPSVGNGICYAAWNFTPADTGRYLVATGTSIITVTKATPTGAPGYTPITASGKTLADAALTAEDTKNQSLFSAFGTAVPGKVKWVDKDGNDLTAQSADIEVKQGESYYWLFTPTDTENYHTLNGTIILWAQTTPSGGGGGGGTSAPAPADNDVKPVERELTQTIAELLARNTDADLVVKISNVEVTLNSRTLETIASEAKGDKIRIVVTENAGLSESQKPVENLIGKNGSIFDLTITLQLSKRQRQKS